MKQERWIWSEATWSPRAKRGNRSGLWRYEPNDGFDVNRTLEISFAGLDWRRTLRPHHASVFVQTVAAPHSSELQLPRLRPAPDRDARGAAEQRHARALMREQPGVEAELWDHFAPLVRGILVR